MATDSATILPTAPTELVATLFAEHYAPLHLDPNGLDAVQDDLADRVEGIASRGRVR
jgi:hypothetical protein